MKDKTERQLNEALDNLKLCYENDCGELIIDEDEDLTKMCEKCGGWYGECHDYTECVGRQCFNYYLAFYYLDWVNGYD